MTTTTLFTAILDAADAAREATFAAADLPSGKLAREAARVCEDAYWAFEQAQLEAGSPVSWEAARQAAIKAADVAGVARDDAEAWSAPEATVAAWRKAELAWSAVANAAWEARR